MSPDHSNQAAYTANASFPRHGHSQRHQGGTELSFLSGSKEARKGLFPESFVREKGSAACGQRVQPLDTPYRVPVNEAHQSCHPDTRPAAFASLEMHSL